MFHWLYIEVWQPMWPNIFAPSFFTLLGVLLSHVKMRKHVSSKHAELKAHVNDLMDPSTPGGLGEIVKDQNGQTS